jgi:hypothetical protein
MGLHATWSASASARLWACPGSLALSAKVPPQPSGAAAQWGTACHTVSEDCLRNGREPEEWIGRTVDVGDGKVECDEEMADTAKVYVDYVRERRGGVDNTGDYVNPLFIEQRFNLAALTPPFDAGGTGDAVIHLAAEKLLEIVDLKGGRGVVVEAEGNKQMRTYALGAMLAFPKLDVDAVKVTIVQPRAPHKDGRIRSEEFHVADLMEWTADLLAAMRESKAAEERYATIKGDLSREEWGAAYLSTGEHCTFCPARAICPAQEKAALDAAGVFFNDRDEPTLRNTPDELDPTRLAKVLDMADMIESWLNACRALAHTLAEGGTDIPGYQLVEKIGRRKWTDEDMVVAGLTAAGMGVDDLYERKLKSPSQVEKTLGSKRKKKLASTLEALTEKPITGLNLVRADKTSRPAVVAGPTKFLSVID